MQHSNSLVYLIKRKPSTGSPVTLPTANSPPQATYLINPQIVRRKPRTSSIPKLSVASHVPHQSPNCPSQAL